MPTIELIQQRILRIRSKNLDNFDWFFSTELFFYCLANSARIWHLKCTAQKRRTHKILTFFEYQWSWLNNENTFVLFFQQQSKTIFYVSSISNEHSPLYHVNIHTKKSTAAHTRKNKNKKLVSIRSRVRQPTEWKKRWFSKGNLCTFILCYFKTKKKYLNCIRLTHRTRDGMYGKNNK